MRRFLGLSLLFLFLLDTPGIDSLSFAESKKEEAPQQKRTRPKKKKVKKKADEKKTEEEFENKVGEKSFSHDQFRSLEDEEAKLDALLILDSSGSMNRTDPSRLRDQASKLFLRFLGPGDRVSVLQFDQEVKRISDFAEVTADNVTQIDGAVQGASSDGRFTDLELPLEEGLKILQSEARSGAKKIVILLSDGKMDPHPSRGTAETLSTKLFDEVLAEYRREKIPVYTVALSAEADQEYLGRIARSTNGLKFDARDVQAVHKSFSDLYLSLKKPQIVGIEAGGFEIDPRVEEATFYISRTDQTKEVALVSPMQERVTFLDFPPGSRWYRGEQYDVVTLRRPTPGGWRVEGLENPEGFATLVTDLKLQVHLSRTNLRVGDSTTVFARLTSEGKVFNKEGLKEITAFRYKVAYGGSIHAQGALVDDGTDGDEKAGDGIYSGTIKADEEGEGKLLVGVTSATFSRQQQIPFEVSRGALALQLKEADSFSGAKERFLATLTKEGAKLKGIEVQLLVKNVETNKIVGYKLKTSGGEEPEFEFETEKLAPGKYSVTARVTGKEGKTGEIRRENSEAIEYTREGSAEKDPHVEEVHEGEEIVEGAVEEGGETTEESGGSIIPGIIGLLGALLWGGGLFVLSAKKLNLGGEMPTREKPYERPESLSEAIRVITEKRAQRSRAPNAQDYELFALVADALPDAESAQDSEETV